MTFAEWVALGSLILAGITMLTARRKDSNEDASFKAKMDAKLDSVNSGMVDVKSEIKASHQQMTQMNERLIKCEKTAENAKDKAEKLEKMFYQVHPPA